MLGCHRRRQRGGVGCLRHGAHRRNHHAVENCPHRCEGRRGPGDLFERRTYDLGVRLSEDQQQAGGEADDRILERLEERACVG